MRAQIKDGVLFLRGEDVPHYKPRGSVVRNNYFWALRSIAARSPFDKPWEFESEVWFALCRMLVSFFESGYLGIRETQLEFLDGTEVPEQLRPVTTWVTEFEPDTLPDYGGSEDSNPEHAYLDGSTAQAPRGYVEPTGIDPASINPASINPASTNPASTNPASAPTISDPSSPVRRASRSIRLG